MKNKKTIILMLALAFSIFSIMLTSASVDINIDIDDHSIELGEDIEFTIEVSSTEDLQSIKIEYGDGEEDSVPASGLEYNFPTMHYEYEDEGDYEITITVNTINDSVEKVSSTITVEEAEMPDEEPTVTLIYPNDDQEIKSEKVSFKFQAQDDLKLTECVYELYIKNGAFKELDYTTAFDNPENNSEIEIPLQDFEDGNYSWYVICKDNKSQSTTIVRDLSIVTTMHERQKEIEYHLDILESFLEKEETMDLEEKRALEDLGIAEDLQYYQKRLIQIDQDLGNNIKFLSDQSLKEKRTVECHEELDEIIKNIPVTFEIEENEEYIKNSLVDSLEEVIKKYAESKNIELSKRELKKLNKFNTNLQNKITTINDIKKIKIAYNESEEEITLIKKEVSLSDNSYTKVLEVFPEELSEGITFLTTTGKVSEGIYEIDLEDIENNEIIYRLYEETNLEKIKDTETILYEEYPPKNIGITGYSIFDAGNDLNNNILPAILIIVTIAFVGVGLFLFLKRKLNVEDERGEFEKATVGIKQTNKLIKEENIDTAKEKYHKLKKMYSEFSPSQKEKIYDKIESIRIEIDKREIRDLIREFEKEKKNKNIREAHEIYEIIKEKYTKLPKKYQQKVYEKLTAMNF